MLPSYAAARRAVIVRQTGEGRPMVRTASLLLLVSLCVGPLAAQQFTPIEGDFTIRNFKFDSGEVLA